MKKHILTQEDLDNYPKLVEQGYEVGQEIDWEIEIEEGGEASTQDDDGDTKHDPIGSDPIKP